MHKLEVTLAAMQLLNELYELIGSGSGYRSIGQWSIIKEKNTFLLPDVYSIYQQKHFKLIMDTDQIVILMKEAHSDAWRIHSIDSFLYFVLCNYSGSRFYEANDNEKQLDAKVKDICFELAEELCL